MRWIIRPEGVLRGAASGHGRRQELPVPDGGIPGAGAGRHFGTAASDPGGYGTEGNRQRRESSWWVPHGQTTRQLSRLREREDIAFIELDATLVRDEGASSRKWPAAWQRRSAASERADGVLLHHPRPDHGGYRRPGGRAAPLRGGFPMQQSSCGDGCRSHRLSSSQKAELSAMWVPRRWR